MPYDGPEVSYDLDELIEAISQATRMTIDEVVQMDTDDFLLLTASIGEQP